MSGDFVSVIKLRTNTEVGTALRSCLRQIKESMSSGGEIEIWVKQNGDLKSCGKLGKDIDLFEIKQNVFYE